MTASSLRIITIVALLSLIIADPLIVYKSFSSKVEGIEIKEEEYGQDKCIVDKKQGEEFTFKFVNYKNVSDQQTCDLLSGKVTDRKYYKIEKAVCTKNEQCISLNCAEKDGEKRCAVLEKEGNCAGGKQCAEGLYCGAENKCVELLKEKATCNKVKSCEKGFACYSLKEGTPTTCQKAFSVENGTEVQGDVEGSYACKSAKLEKVGTEPNFKFYCNERKEDGSEGEKEAKKCFYKILVGDKEQRIEMPAVRVETNAEKQFECPYGYNQLSNYYNELIKRADDFGFSRYDDVYALNTKEVERLFYPKFKDADSDVIRLMANSSFLTFGAIMMVFLAFL